MLDIGKITANAILAVPLSDPERLFSSPGDARAEYRALAMRWHPDHGGTTPSSPT